jgi:hypothetical protein
VRAAARRNLIVTILGNIVALASILGREGMQLFGSIFREYRSNMTLWAARQAI